MLSDSLRRLAGIELRELQGSTLAGELPLPDALVNRLLARRLSAMSGPIARVTLTAHDDQRVGVKLGMRDNALIPGLTIATRIVRQPDLPAMPVLALQWSIPGLGPLARLAAPALSFFKTLPRGIRMDGDLVEVDLAELLRAYGYAELLDLITRLHVHTREGAFVVRFEARVPTASESAASR